MKTFEEAVGYYIGDARDIQDRCRRFDSLKEQVVGNEDVDRILAGVASITLQEEMSLGGDRFETLRVAMFRAFIAGLMIGVAMERQEELSVK